MKKRDELGNAKNETKKGAGWRNLFNWLALFGLFYGELDERLELRLALQKILKKPVPRGLTIWGCFGGISFFLFLIQVITGVMLLMYYRPTIDQAYESIVHITNNVPYGWLIRGMHYWASNLMVLTLFIHLLKVFFSAAYKPPRDLNWVVGVSLFSLTLIFGFTGYLLPWTQLSYWATVVGTEIAGAVPLIGNTIKILARGGEEIGQLTLTRFFALHVAILPWIFIFLLIPHFMMIRRLGISEPL